MTLEEAAAHIDGPVLAYEGGNPGGGPFHEGQVVAVDEQRGLVQLRLRRKRHPYDLLPRSGGWWHPARLSVPQWWLDRKEAQ